MIDYFVIGGSKYVPETAPVQLYMVKHDYQLGGARIPPEGLKGCPEVFLFEPEHVIELTEPLQRLWKDINPDMTGMEWRKLLYDNYAFCNRQGFEKAFNNGPRADYINRLDIGAANPRMDKCRVCGGGLLTEKYTQDGYLYPEYIDVTKPLPTAAEVLAKRLYFVVTNVYYPSGSVGGVPASLTAEERVPLFAKAQIRYPLAKLVRLDMSQALPSPFVQR